MDRLPHKKINICIALFPSKLQHIYTIIRSLKKNTGYAGVRAYLLDLPLNCPRRGGEEDTVECA